MLFYNFTFITLIFIRPVLEKYSRVLYFNTLLYSILLKILILYSTRVTTFTSILYSTWVLKFQYFTQHCNDHSPTVEDIIWQDLRSLWFYFSVYQCVFLCVCIRALYATVLITQQCRFIFRQKLCTAWCHFFFW